jgi:hypothetical protein
VNGLAEGARALQGAPIFAHDQAEAGGQGLNRPAGPFRQQDRFIRPPRAAPRAAARPPEIIVVDSGSETDGEVGVREDPRPAPPQRDPRDDGVRRRRAAPAADAAPAPSGARAAKARQSAIPPAQVAAFKRAQSKSESQTPGGIPRGRGKPEDESSSDEEPSVGMKRGRSRFVKGSEEARAYMASLRAKRKPKTVQ